MERRIHVIAALAALMLVVSSTARAEMGGDAKAGKARAIVCAACHGVDGNGGANPAWPKLAGQVPEYLVNQLMHFKSGARKNPIMGGMAATLSEQDMKNVAAYFASQKSKPGTAGDKKLAREGERIYRGGVVHAGVPACMSCHGPSGRGVPPNFPQLYSQRREYVSKQLLDFRAGRRVSAAGIMPHIASRLTEPQIKAVSEYISGLH